MTTLTETRHAGGFLVWEALRDYCRSTVILASAHPTDAGRLAVKVQAQAAQLAQDAEHCLGIGGDGQPGEAHVAREVHHLDHLAVGDRGVCLEHDQRVRVLRGGGAKALAERVVIEDGAFIGSRCIVVEGVRVGEEAVIGAGTTLTASTMIIDVSGPTEVVTKGFVPPRSVVIPGTRLKKFPAGEYGVNCALIIGQRKESTDRKTSLNDVLREFAVAV